MDRTTKRFPTDRDVIGVNFLAIVADQGLGYGAWHSGLVEKCCGRPAQAVKGERIDFPSDAASYSTAAMAHSGRPGSQSSLYKEITECVR